MKNKIFGDIENRCEYCAFGGRTPDGTSVLCAKKGISPLDSSCKKYKYDPLKRVPRPRPDLPEYTAEDFEL